MKDRLPPLEQVARAGKPLLLVAELKAPGTVDSAAGVTILGSVGLIATAMITRKDFSFLRGILFLGFIGVMAVGIAGAIFGFHVGLWFSAAIVLLFCGYILYDTSNILRRYPTNMAVSAAVILFTDVVLLFKHILILLMASRD